MILPHIEPAELEALDLAAIEALAVEMAQLAGAQIAASLGRTLAVRYKMLDAAEEAVYRDPVSEIDQSVERLIRDQLSERFPDHGIIGEEDEPVRVGASDFVWIIDPVDGTTNFVNGYPLFAASIGVAYRGRPVVGAVWCSTSHALRSGVYHARSGGLLAFDQQPIAGVDRKAVRRRIVGLPRVPAGVEIGFEARQSGSAAIECAFVAAGLLAGARFDAPNAWDVAGGIPLLEAAKATVLTKAPDGEWADFAGFGPVDAPGPAWRRPLAIGERTVAEALSRLTLA